ncbi:uncharacterized protein LOC143040353 isoform X2 [Oratosquilla oratoria]
MSLGWGGMMVGPSGWWVGGGAGSKSAVQLLQESKSRYVKSDQVLVSRQQPARPERLHISSNPNIFLSAPSHTLHVSKPSPLPERRHGHHSQGGSPHEGGRSGGGNNNNSLNARDHGGPQSLSATSPSGRTPAPPGGHHQFTPPSGPISLGAVLSVVPPPLPARSPRVTPRPRAKTQPEGGTKSGDLRRSLSHGPGDRGDDIQMKLRRLLNTDSKENLSIVPTSPHKSSPPSHIEFRDFPRPEGKARTPPARFSSSPSGTFRAEPATVTLHKSLPDLASSSSCGSSMLIVPPDSGSDTTTMTSGTGMRRPSCPGAIHTSPAIDRAKDLPPDLPPKPPRMFRDPPKSPPARPPPTRPPPPQNLAFFHPRAPLAKAPIAFVPKNTLNPECRRSSDSDVSNCGATDETKRRPILRSRSDVSHERWCCRWDDDPPVEDRRPPIDLEAFFDSMGLDGSTKEIILNPSPHSSPIYFEDISSQESWQGRRASSDSDEAKGGGPGGGGAPRPSVAARIGCLGTGSSYMPPLTSGEPSIVEKNARVIKWLFNCQKAHDNAIARSPTKS